MPNGQLSPKEAIVLEPTPPQPSLAFFQHAAALLRTEGYMVELGSSLVVRRP